MRVFFVPLVAVLLFVGAAQFAPIGGKDLASRLEIIDPRKEHDD